MHNFFQWLFETILKIIAGIENKKNFICIYTESGEIFSVTKCPSLYMQEARIWHEQAQHPTYEVKVKQYKDLEENEIQIISWQ